MRRSSSGQPEVQPHDGRALRHASGRVAPRRPGEGQDGVDDPSLRPNQLLAIALPHPVLAREHWRSVLDAVRGALLTPVGVRRLAPGHPDYRARYDGDLRARDAAYHQGTASGWLLGPLVDAWRRADGQTRRRGLLDARSLRGEDGTWIASAEMT
jgi:glycogen debranching enzyme